jgi:imidazolonepropionase-like amidohydrolase
MILDGGTVIDGTGADPRQAAIAIEHGRIDAIGDTARGEVVDVSGLTVLPGLIDAHTHFGLVSEFDPDVAPAITAARIFRNCELALDAGFTTVRDTGGIDGGVAQAAAIGLIRGPRILPSGPVLSQTGGHGDHTTPFHHPHLHDQGIPGLAQVSILCDGPDEVRLAARTALKRGATQVKVCVSGGVVSFTDKLEDTQFSVEELMAAVQEADARGTYVTAHAHNSKGIQNGLDAGIECFEHGTYLDEETARRMAAAGAHLVPTFAVCRLLAQEAEAWGIPAELVPKIAPVEVAMAQSLKLAREHGIVIGLGSDILGPEQDRRGLELVIRAALEDPLTAITSATKVNAQIIRRDAELGTLEVGKVADVIAVDGDPLADPEVFDDPSRVKLVIQGGRIVKDLR